MYQPPISGTLVLECNDKLYGLLFATGKGSWSKFQVLFLRFFTRSNTILAHNGVYVLSWTPIILEVLYYKKNPHYTLVAYNLTIVICQACLWPSPPVITLILLFSDQKSRFFVQNVCFKKNCTKLNSVLLLCLVRIFMKQMLLPKANLLIQNCMLS